MALLHGTLIDRVAKIITRYNMLPGGARLGVAVSGGADSIALLHILRQLAPNFAAALTVLHVDHQLRGAESDEDAAFVQAEAARCGLPCRIERLPVNLPGNLEENARNLRRDFFRRARLELGLTAVALGHTRSDQAETVLFRLFRGAGTAGLAGMRFVTPDAIIRPLLTLSREEIRAWAAEAGLAWREDTTNADLRFSRNRLRLETAPYLAKTFNPNLEQVLSGVAEAAQDEEDFWRRQCEAALSRLGVGTRWGLSFPVSELSQLPPALLRRLMRTAIIGIKDDHLPPDLQHVAAICELCRSTEGHDRVMTQGVDAMRSFGTLVLARPGQLSENRHYRFELAIGAVCELPFGIGTVALESIGQESTFYGTVKENPQFDVDSVTLTLETLTTGGLVRPLLIRNWLPGDELLRPGHRSPEKLKALFQQYRVPLWERKHWPVLISGKELLWTRRFGCASSIAKQAGVPEFRFTYACGTQAQ